jgi:hypothetical protein
MHDLLRAAPRQIMDQAGIRSSPDELTDDQRTVQFGRTEEIESGNVPLIIGHARMIITLADRAYPSCYVAVGAPMALSASISRRRHRIAEAPSHFQHTTLTADGTYARGICIGIDNHGSVFPQVR